MTAPTPITDDFAADKPPISAAVGAHDLCLNLSGYEGPIDLLLNLAKDQKVDLKHISILQLADQYLNFIAEAKYLRLEIAADYLVMAAWLAYLKSRLLLPTPPKEEPSAEDMAAALAFQLQRLQAMQQAAERLFNRSLLGRDTFARPPLRLIEGGLEDEAEKPAAPQALHITLHELLSSLSVLTKEDKQKPFKLAATELFAMEEAAQRLREMLGYFPDWANLRSFLPVVHERGQSKQIKLKRRSSMAAAFAAVLEMVKLGELQVRQESTFGDIMVRKPPVADAFGLDDISFNGESLA